MRKEKIPLKKKVLVFLKLQNNVAIDAVSKVT
jgi:hypothetical protein